MEEIRVRRETTTSTTPPLHTCRVLRRAIFNRVFSIIYMSSILALFFHHTQNLHRSKTLLSFSITALLFLADFILAFMWTTAQSCCIRPVKRQEFPETLKRVVKVDDLPGLDVFICTADPWKEPLITVVNTVLSVMGYDYPTDKMSVYVSDDGGSELTLFALMEAAKFARYWLPFCRNNNVEKTSPEVYFASNDSWNSDIESIKMMYENMKLNIANVLKIGKVAEEFIKGDEQREAFSKWTDGFTRQDHPTVVQVLLENGKDEDNNGYNMPNLVYISREKNTNSEHHFKAGAQNALLRVSATMTNAPIILTLDCDMSSNDPQTVYRALCYFFNPPIKSRFGYVQFPQRFRGLSRNDVYGGALKSAFVFNALGMDGFLGHNYIGTGCFFDRIVFFGGPFDFVAPEIDEFHPTHVVDKSIKSKEVLVLANHVASCNYEKESNWGYKIGFRYGSLVEDYFTGYMLQCEGWRSVLCDPDKAAFLGDAPINLFDVLIQTKRWCIGFLEVGFSRWSPIVYGVQNRGLIVAFGYLHYALWSLWAIPLTIYAFIPQLALLNGLAIFPKATELWFFLYVFLFVGVYVKDLLNFLLEGDSIRKWWNDQRMWMIRGATSFSFALIEFTLKSLHINLTSGFNVTNKVLDHEQNKRYTKEIFEFGVSSPLFLPLSMVAIINLLSFVYGLVTIFSDNLNIKYGEGTLVLQLLLAGVFTLNCLPIYESMIFRSDQGKMPTNISVIAIVAVLIMYLVTHMFFSK